MTFLATSYLIVLLALLTQFAISRPHVAQGTFVILLPIIGAALAIGVLA